MRTVMVKIKERVKRDGGYDYITHNLEGKFHEWGVSYEEFENGPGNYSVGIVEMPGGKVELVHPENITFTDVEKKDV